MPPISTRRVDRSMKNRTTNRFSPVDVHTSIVKKSDATSWLQCRTRNSFQVVFLFRSGARSMPLLFEDVCNRFVSQYVTEICKGSLNSSITPATILLSHAYDKGSNLLYRSG